MKERPGESPDILTADIDWPDDWYLIGSGPKGLSLRGKHRDDMFTFCGYQGWGVMVAVNGGLMLGWPDYWLVADINVKKYPWFDEAYKTTRAIKIFGPQYDAGFGEYTFVDGSVMNYDNAVPEPGVLRAGATVGGMALQMAYHCGAKRIYLIGFDHYGREYATGDKCLLSEQCHAHDGVWNSVNRFNSLIKFCQERGVYVASLTDTALDVEVLR